MQIERLSPPAPLPGTFAVNVLRQAYRRKKRPAPMEKIKEHIPAAQEHLQHAEAWLEAHYGLVCLPADYRLTFTEKLRPALSLPLWPATELTSVTRNGVPSAGWAIKNGILWHPVARFFKRHAESTLVVTLRTGWEPGELPHLLEIGLGAIVRHWVENPAAAQNHDVPKNVAATVDQFVAIFRPHRDRSVAAWL